MYPTDVIKTRIQLSTGKSESLPTIVRNLISKEGWTALYRGISAPIVSEAPKRAVKFSANEFYRGLFKNSEGKLTPLGYFGAGACAGTTEAFVNCPFEVVKVRMQAPESKELYKSTSHAAKEMLVKEGPTALYKGLEAQVWLTRSHTRSELCSRSVCTMHDIHIWRYVELSKLGCDGEVHGMFQPSTRQFEKLVHGLSRYFCANASNALCTTGTLSCPFVPPKKLFALLFLLSCVGIRPSKAPRNKKKCITRRQRPKCPT